MRAAVSSAERAPYCSPAADGIDPPGPEAILWGELAISFLLLVTFSWLGIDLGRHSSGVATIWFSNGLLFAFVIRKHRSLWPWFFATGFLADIAADILYGDTVATSLGVSAANSVEVILSALLLTHFFGSPFKLSRLRPLLGFLGIAAIAGPAVSSLLGPTWLKILNPSADWWEMTRVWYLGDSLGMAIIAPLVFILQRPGFFKILAIRELPGTLLTLSVPALITVAVFAQTTNPLLFVIFPALIFIVFRLGFPGAVLSIVLIAAIAIPLTIIGHGPTMLITGVSLQHRIVIVQLFLAVALFTALPIAALLEQRKWLETSLLESEAQYRQLANTDALTGQGNRRAFDERLIAAWCSPEATGQHLALISIDVDLFKAYNDIYGHIAGDECLRRIAIGISSALRSSTVSQLFRLGGEEFAIILPNTNVHEALALAERLLKVVFDLNIEHTGLPLGRQTISIGVAATVPTPETSVLSLLDRCDQALYSAKRLGRNRAQAAGPDASPAVSAATVNPGAAPVI